MVEEGLKQISVIIPTLNAGKDLPGLFESLSIQTLKPREILVVDSSSSDGTAELARELGARVLSIPQEEFNHGLTRTLAGKAARGEVLVYLTQDARLAHPEALENLVSYLARDQVAMAYGRQIAPPGSSPLVALHRLFNYGDRSYILSYEDRYRFGLRTVFASNSFAGYRRQALERIGWFPALPASEDVHAAARFLKMGYRVAYVATACVYHAHDLSFREEFVRYLNIGRFYAAESWILEEFGHVEGEGRRYLFFALKHLCRHPHLLPAFFLRSLVRYLGYRLGLLLGPKTPALSQSSALPPEERGKADSFVGNSFNKEKMQF